MAREMGSSVGASTEPDYRACSPRRVIDVKANQPGTAIPSSSLSSRSHFSQPIHFNSNHLMSHQDSDSGTDSDQEPIVDKLSLGASLGSSPAWANIVKSLGRTPERSLSGSGLGRSTSRSVGIKPEVNNGQIQIKQQTGYPSPPTTPEATQPDVTEFPLLDPRDSVPSFPAHFEPPLRPRARVASTTSLSSLRPPRSPFAVRTPSIASISTLPPDFGRYAQVASGWATEPTLAVQNHQHSHSSPLLHSFTPANKAESDKSAVSPAWRRAIANKLGRLRPAWPSGWDAKPRESRASELLAEVLKRDDQSAGEGMYWATEEEHDQLVEELSQEQAVPEARSPSPSGSHAPFSSVASSSGTRSLAPSVPATLLATSPARPAITQRRSFVDPTEAARDDPTPNNQFLRPPQGSSSRRRRHVSSPLSGAPKGPVGTDPLLLELERKSRVGVKTRCMACGKSGYNFPATKEGRTFCSRECRRGKAPAVAVARV